MATMSPQQDPSQAQGAPSDESQEQFVVCIAAQADGTYSVYAQDSDDDQDDAAQGQGSGQGDDEGPQTAQSIEEALKIAGDMLSEEAGEDSGEGSGDGNAPVSDPNAVWNQLAKRTDAKRGA